MSKAPECVDCIAQGSPTWRPIKSGTRKPRCATHTHAAAKQARLAAHARMVQKTYGLPEGAYWALYEAQGGKCAICQVATGKTKRLAVDHDHVTGEVYGLCCGPCNIMLGRLGRRPDPYLRTINYLYDPPARRAIGPCFVPLTDAPESGNTSTLDGAKLTTTDGGELVILSE